MSCRVAGQFNLSATGKGAESMPPELQQALIAQGMEDATLRARIVEWLTRPAGSASAEGGGAAPDGTPASANGASVTDGSNPTSSSPLAAPSSTNSITSPPAGP